MLSFNLLPPELRKRVIFSQQAKKIGAHLNVFLGLLGVLSFFLLFVLIYLQNQYVFFRGELDEVKRSSQNLRIEQIKSDIARFNNQLTRISAPLTPPDWTLFLGSLAAVTPEGVVLHSLGVSRNAGDMRISIEGSAKRREDVIQLEKSIRSSPFFSNVVSPLSNYAKTEDVPFTISFFLRPEMADKTSKPL